MNALPSKQELLDFQARWMGRAGLAALAGAFISVAAVGIQQIGLHLPSGNSTADQLAFVHAHSGRLIIASIVQAIGIAFFTVPLAFLFRAASGRAERMRRRFIWLVIAGPLLLGISLIVVSIGGRQVSNDFAARAPAAEQHARQQAQAAANAATSHAGQPSAKTKGAAGTGSTTAATTTTPPTTPAANPPTPEQAANNARENVADDVNKHSGLLGVGQLFQLLGVLSILFAFVYVPLWAMRTGLLTRALGYVGIAAGVFLIFPVIPKFSGLVSVIWFAVLGLMFLRVWIRPLPPAWAAGEAIPWPGPGEDIGPPPEQRGPPGTVEGSGREVSEPPLSENGGPVGEPGEAQSGGETQGQRRKKRKRRR